VSNRAAEQTDVLDEIEQRANAAMPGPWGRMGSPGKPVVPTQGSMEAAPGLTIGSIGNTEPIARFSGYLMPLEANVEFCIHAREDVPWLIGEVKRLRAIEAAAREVAVSRPPMLVTNAEHEGAFRVLRTALAAKEGGHQ
jgi:hypothetical protein